MKGAVNRLFAIVGRAAAVHCAAIVLAASLVDIENRHGAVVVRSVDSDQLTVEAWRDDEQLPPAEIVVARRPDRIQVRAAPQDGGAVEIRVGLPLGARLEARTLDGAIEIVGMVPAATLATESGAIRLEIPWTMARLSLDADEKPDRVATPRGVKFIDSKVDITGGRTLWRFRDTLPERSSSYGFYRIRARRPAAVELVDFTPPHDWPIQFHWAAAPLLERMLRGEGPEGGAVSPRAGDFVAADDPDGGATFRSDVRMVNLMVSATDPAGRPVVDLRAPDFSVKEDGKPQQTAFAGSQETPFNLAILLDLSGSTRPDRIHMLTAAESFIRMARDEDRVAIYALADGHFHVVSRLTSDRQALLERARALPEISGDSPVYDAIVLAYADELWARMGERNALIVITDGLDNQITKQDTPSSVKFAHLERAAKEMHALVFPVFLRSAERFNPKFAEAARKNLERLATASGGRFFAVRALEDLAPVFPEIEEELRSVYGVAYYPANQDFDGKWRKVDIRVSRPRVNLRARPGYYAR